MVGLAIRRGYPPAGPMMSYPQGGAMMPRGFTAPGYRGYGQPQSGMSGMQGMSGMEGMSGMQGMSGMEGTSGEGGTWVWMPGGMSGMEGAAGTEQKSGSSGEAAK